jgi:hypothetical protein
MPNWVYNNLSITGTKADIDAFVAKATTPHTTRYEPFLSDEPSEQLREDFSFWNFIRPDEDKLDLYFETNGSHKDPETGEMIRTGDNEYNWYNWNIRNWGCKWDARETELEVDELSDGRANLRIKFDTAWDKPDPVFYAMVEQHPELEFDFHWEEEQGWGGEASGINGEYRLYNEWDIPEYEEAV